MIDWFGLVTFTCAQMSRKIVLSYTIIHNVGYSSNSNHMVCIITNSLVNKTNLSINIFNLSINTSDIRINIDTLAHP